MIFAVTADRDKRVSSTGAGPTFAKVSRDLGSVAAESRAKALALAREEFGDELSQGEWIEITLTGVEGQ